MLAQNFLSLEDLPDLKTEEERQAFIRVLAKLERGELRHYQPYCNRRDLWPTNGFNMSWTMVKDGCGTVACIGGWISAELGIHPNRALDYVYGARDALCHLFFPVEGYYEAMSNITVEEAAAALRNYLTTGNADWDSVLS